MLLLQLLLCFCLLAVCSFAPGFFFVRRFRWSPLEKLCGSVGLSLLMVFLAAWGVYLATPGSGSARIACLCIASICLLAGIAARRDVARLFHSRRARQAILAFGFLFVWTLLILGMIRSYSGGAWFGDWLEHFQRSLFFLHHFPLQTVMLGGYSLPARPPMMNVLAAFFLALTGDRFEIFQLVFTFLNLLVFLPCVLIVPALGGRRRLGVLPLLCLFALNPVVMENATYSWTKLFAAFYVVLAICLYLAGWRKRDRLRIIAAFAALCAGVLVHYSAAPYLLILGAHYLFFVWPSRRRKGSELAAIVVICAALLMVWVGWSIQSYGLAGTFASNTTVTSSQHYEGSTLGKIAGNLVDSFIPVLLRDPEAVRSLSQPNSAGTWRDVAFVLYQPNLILGMGLVGGPLILFLLYSAFERRKACKAEGRFWLGFVPCCVLAGIAVVGERDTFGDAHLTLLAMEVIGLAWLAGSLPLRRTMATALVFGALVDFSLGIFLQARVEHLENEPGRVIYTGLTFSDGRYRLGDPGPLSLSVTAGRNWFRKHQVELSRRWLGELTPHLDGNAEAQKLADNLQSYWKEDDAAWGGWYFRQGGSVEFLGDHASSSIVAGLDVAVLLAAFLGLMKGLWESAFHREEVPAAARNDAGRGGENRDSSRRRRPR